jgi:hypothetical protein
VAVMALADRCGLARLLVERLTITAKGGAERQGEGPRPGRRNDLRPPSWSRCTRMPTSSSRVRSSFLRSLSVVVWADGGELVYSEGDELTAFDLPFARSGSYTSSLGNVTSWSRTRKPARLPTSCVVVCLLTCTLCRVVGCIAQCMRCSLRVCSQISALARHVGAEEAGVSLDLIGGTY